MNAKWSARIFVLTAGLALVSASSSGCSYETSFDSITCESSADCIEGALCSDGYCVADTSVTNNTNNQTTLDRIEISPATTTVIVGETVTFSATVFDTAGEVVDTPVSWTIADPTVATFDEVDGELQALAIGSTQLTATVENVSATAEITVETNIGGVVVEPAMVNLGLGTSTALSAVVQDVNGMPLDAQVTWSSSDPGTVSVSDDGTIEGIVLGEATVTAEFQGASDSATVNVIEVDPASLDLEPESARIRTDGTLEVRAVIRDEDMNVIRGQVVQWQYNPPIGGLSIPGGQPDVANYRAELEGTTTVTATLGELTDSMTIEIYEPEVTSVDLQPTDPTIAVDERFPLTVTVIDEDGIQVADPTVQWFTTDSTVAQVDEMTNELLGISQGPATITADVDGITDMIDVNVVFRSGSISAGNKHTCALTPAGTAWCWGEAGEGQLGNGSSSDQALPSPVDTMVTFDEIDTGDGLTCARDGGDLYCWGSSLDGRLGIDPVPSTTDVPQLVSSSLQFVQISMTDDHVCALDSQSDIYCWGEGADGRLGNDSEVDETVPTKIEDPDGQSNKKWKAVAAGVSHTCAIDMSDALWCWGANGSGELGNNSTTPSFKPVAVSVASIGSPQFIRVTAGGGFSCAITAANDSYCWGSNASGKLGIASSDATRDTPAMVDGGLKFMSISADFDHACGVTITGETYCWGEADHGRLGYGMRDDKDAPIAIDSMLTFSSVTTGADHSCAVTMNSRAYCWGRDDRDQLGAQNPGDSNSPVLVWP